MRVADKTMKIFNWLSCKLHNTSNYTQVSTQTKVGFEIVGREEKVLHETKPGRNAEALLLQDILNEILTIGTLGYNHPLLSEGISVQDELKDVKEELEVKEFPVVVVTNHELPMVEPVKLKILSEEQNQVQVFEKEASEEEIIMKLPLLKEDKEQAVKRITLADLFAAEALSDNEQVQKESDSDNFKGKQHKKYCKIDLQDKTQKSSKPMVAAAKTTKKLQKLMMKMLKKKVHPVMAAAKGEFQNEKNDAENLLRTVQLASDAVNTATLVLPSQHRGMQVELRGY